jgi:hypothetical protein
VATGGRGLRGFRTLLACALAALGVALLVVTALHGGGEVGFVLGPLFVVAGIGRLYLMRGR